MALLTAHYDSVTAARKGAAVREDESAKAQLIRKLADMHERLSDVGHGDVASIKR